MDSFESRLREMEGELQSLARQNRRLRALLPSCLVLMGLPFVLGLVRTGNVTFDTVTASQFQVTAPSGKTMVLIGTGTNFNTRATAGSIILNDANGQNVVKLDGMTQRGGGLALLEEGTPNSSSNRGLVQITVQKFRPDSKAFGQISLLSSGGGALNLRSNPQGSGELQINGPAQNPLIQLGGSARTNDGQISVKAAKGRSEILLETESPNSPLQVRSGRLGNVNPGAATKPTSGGGGRLTVKDSNGNAIFVAPNDPTAAVAKGG